VSETASVRTLEAGHLTLRSVREGDDHCVALFGELDIASADALEAEVRRVEATDAKRIVVDLSALEFMDSTGIRVLLALDARSRSDGNRLGLLRGPPAVHQVLQITQTDTLLPFLD
jgi:anti-anti-sigma factor